VAFDGHGLATTPVPESRLPGMSYQPMYGRLQAFIPKHLLLRPGTYPITAGNPKPRGGGSNAAYFLVRFA